MDWPSDPQIWASLLMLTALEIVRGIDNLVFIAILAGRLSPEHQARAGQVGLALALITRLRCSPRSSGSSGLPGRYSRCSGMRFLGATSS